MSRAYCHDLSYTDVACCYTLVSGSLTGLANTFTEAKAEANPANLLGDGISQHGRGQSWES